MHSSAILFVFALFSLTFGYVIPHRHSRYQHRRQLPLVEAHNGPTVMTLTPANAQTTSTPASATTDAVVLSSTSLSSLPLSSAPTPATTQAPASSGKLVVAHHMVGNTFPYTKQDWAEDIQLAHAAGIDGFALNTGREDWEPARIADAYQAALESGLDFKLFLSLDLASLHCNSPDDATRLRNRVAAHVSHPNQLKYHDRAFVSTFSGERCQFGQGSVADGWKSQFARHPELDGKIYFVPSFFMEPAKFSEFSGVMNGDFNWNSGWPIQVTTSFAQEQMSKAGPGNARVHLSVSDVVIDALKNPLQRAVSQFIGGTDSDSQHLDALNALQKVQKRDGEDAKPVYMAAVSPWFFTHYGQDTFNKNWIYLSDQHLYSKRWESLVETRDQLDIVQILTWNDYGESHYIGPIKGAQPKSEAWTEGMPHSAWLELTKYYAEAFKTGQYPTVEKDKIFMWSRPHSTQAESPDPVPRPDNFELMEDAVWAVVITSKPSTVVLTTSAASSRSFDVPAGVSKLSIPITPGGTMRGVIQRDGNTVVELNPGPEAFTFQGSPKSYNFNVFVASATAP
ncbi:glycoside hydrolase family 71 protein [Coprinopsis sp. MPI-PUGE-AT-0042]|nr:glycoside hydrolase family 71 protein [Coprinopsis sp. MPI-PUGE-AT-0042]